MRMAKAAAAPRCMRGAGAHDMLEVGFTAPRAHHIVAIDRCPILAPGLDGAIAAAWAIAEILKPAESRSTSRRPHRHRHGRRRARLGTADPARATALARVAEQQQARPPHPPRRTGGAAEPADDANRPRARRRCRPAPFCRRRKTAKRRWRGWCIEHAGGAKRVADLFCGIGTFALRLAETARVTAADSDAAAIKALQGARGDGLKAHRGGGARPVPPAVDGLAS